MMRKVFIYILLISIAISQKSDPRTVALAGATTTIADGIYAVGYNPALIAFQKRKTIHDANWWFKFWSWKQLSFYCWFELAQWRHFRQ